MSKKRFVTTGEIAKICEVSPKTVIAWIERKQLRSFRIGRGPRKVTLADLYDFLGSRNFPIGSLEEGTAGVVLVEPCDGDVCHVKWPAGNGFVYNGADYRSLKIP